MDLMRFLQASIMTMNPDPNAVIPTVIAGTVNALSAAAKTSSVKRFVLTSSSTALLLPEPNKPLVVTEGWSPSPETGPRKSKTTNRNVQ